MASVTIHEEVSTADIPAWRLCLQKVTYNYDDGSTEDGLRFIWRRPDDTLQAARGQARIPDASTLLTLVGKAAAEGWLL